MPDAIFNPNQGLPGLEPWVDPHSALTVTGVGHGNTPTGRSIAYLRLVLSVRCGRTSLHPAANYGPWTYSNAVASAVRDLRVFMGLPAGYDCTEATRSRRHPTWTHHRGRCCG